MSRADEFIDGVRKKQDEALTLDRLLAAIGGKRRTTAELCKKLNCSERGILDAVKQAQEKNYLVTLYGDRWSIEKAPPKPSKQAVYDSREDGTYLFGFASDQHIGSKYFRHDVLEDLYDKFERCGADRVFNAGNWIDGEARFNRHDLECHGIDEQLDRLACVYPVRNGLVTYGVAGDDHEGWFAQREGIDIGAHAERVMRDHGRTDWINLGYMEAFVRLRHAKSGKSTQLLLQHPGGGSAYAISYTSQKTIESLEGGEKPAVLLQGHYHKMLFANVRNVWCIQCGCCQDQTPFMRKKRLEAHIGGGLCKLTQDPRTGAITACQVEFFRYFDKGYYQNNRWKPGGKVTLPKRK